MGVLAMLQRLLGVVLGLWALGVLQDGLLLRPPNERSLCAPLAVKHDAKRGVDAAQDHKEAQEDAQGRRQAPGDPLLGQAVAVVHDHIREGHVACEWRRKSGAGILTR
eukprot:CAMPEP_0177608326 /NCGR_PEP_ID=MMETSP0419_2-20121207/18410_1 /TAXON_ID=582737 /ORGANISM="Tetraselmis sp., Strain GSL018" /LENGTH=107 /DNA_ID=CAMNT_0019103005 /DNA_START=178 /DNA_END=501 /DNA_ORIENTATION=-